MFTNKYKSNLATPANNIITKLDKNIKKEEKIKKIKEKLLNETYILLTLEEKIEMFYDIQKELQLRQESWVVW